MATAKNQASEAKTEAAAAEQALTVNQIGDVTERTELAPAKAVAENLGIRPMGQLPKSHAGLKKQYPGAKGFSEAGNMIALHF